ncbi:AbrB/MazE/SpoVT family DNA-binding domain-containing protein [Natrinema soli]|uniref:AbrB/MazE/SpoVT family DNA-binding domain-containing protein n=1 Tax=Natrinema soli TaxID=1930624 RepID=A0ABD5SVG9_9EURY|nr:AbrB/MazE/SpoVT family DNA-binding domain-containing protein [Natrinema soli]
MRGKPRRLRRGGCHSVTVPAAVRRELDIESGDKIRWRVTEDGTLSVEVVTQRYGAFSKFDPVGIGYETDAANDHDLIAGGNPSR